MHLRDFLRDADISDLCPQLAPLKKLRRLETDGDGLLIIRESGVHLSVSPEQLLRAIKAYDAVLKRSAEQGWRVQAVEGSCLKIIVSGETLELTVTEKTDPIPGVVVRPGERRPRRPAGLLVISLTDGFSSVSVSDKRGTTVERKLPDLFLKAEALANQLKAEKDEAATRQREYERESRRRREIEKRLERLNRELSGWQRAEQIRAYARTVEQNMSKDQPLEPESDAAKWLKWVRQHADKIDPTTRRFEIAAQEFWDWHLVTPD